MICHTVDVDIPRQECITWKKEFVPRKWRNTKSCCLVVSRLLRLVLCSKRGPINSKRWTKASTGRRNFSWNSLGFSMSKSRLSSKFLGWRITRRLSSSSSSVHSKTTYLGAPISFSEVILYVYKWHATCILDLWFKSWTLVKIHSHSC